MADRTGKTPWGWIVGALGVIAAIITVVVFFTGKNLPDFFPPSSSLRPSAVSLPSMAATAASQSTPSAAPIRSIGLPETVFGFTSMDNQTRQSYLLSPSQAKGTAYAYKYWQDDQSVWLDATASAGGDTSSVSSGILDAAKSKGQQTDNDGLVTCVWDQDSDPNTPMHTEKCFIIDSSRNLALLAWTEAQTVGDSDGARLTEQIWNTMTLSQ